MSTEKLTPQRSNTAAAAGALNTKQKHTSSAKGKAKKRLATLSRWLHIYLSMLSFTILLFFAITGLTLNHADWFTNGKALVIKEKGVLNKDWVNQTDTTKINKLEIVEFLRNKYHVKGALTDFRIEDTELSLTFNGPGYIADSFINKEDGHFELSVTKLGAVAILNDLHKGRDTGKSWSWLIDVSAILMTIVSLSGIVLICFIKKKRLTGLVMVVVGTILCYLIYKFLVP